MSRVCYTLALCIACFCWGYMQHYPKQDEGHWALYVGSIASVVASGLFVLARS